MNAFYLNAEPESEFDLKLKDFNQDRCRALCCSFFFLFSSFSIFLSKFSSFVDLVISVFYVVVLFFVR
jgi:hypothetical protein